MYVTETEKVSNVQNKNYKKTATLNKGTPRPKGPPGTSIGSGMGDEPSKLGTVSYVRFGEKNHKGLKTKVVGKLIKSGIKQSNKRDLLPPSACDRRFTERTKYGSKYGYGYYVSSKTFPGIKIVVDFECDNILRISDYVLRSRKPQSYWDRWVLNTALVEEFTLNPGGYDAGAPPPPDFMMPNQGQMNEMAVNVKRHMAERTTQDIQRRQNRLVEQKKVPPKFDDLRPKPHFRIRKYGLFVTWNKTPTYLQHGAFIEDRFGSLHSEIRRISRVDDTNLEI